MIEARYKEFPLGWIGIVFDKETGTVLTVGQEDTESHIQEWLELAREIEPWIEGNPQVPDFFDRATRH